MEDDLAKHLPPGTVEYKSNVQMKKNTWRPDEPGYPPACMYTAVRDPIVHFLSGYNEIEYRTTKKRTWPSAPYHTDLPLPGGNDNDPQETRKKRFRGFVEDLLVEDGSFLVSSVYSHCFSMGRVLAVLAEQGRTLTGYLPDLVNLEETWPRFFTETCPGLPPLEAFPQQPQERRRNLSGRQHESSSDPLGTYGAAKDVWAEGGPVARALCLLVATDYACWNHTIPDLCRSVYTEHGPALTTAERRTDNQDISALKKRPAPSKDTPGLRFPTRPL